METNNNDIAIQKYAFAEMSEKDSIEIEELIKAGEYMKAIGRYRELTGADLAAAKSAVDKYMSKNEIIVHKSENRINKANAKNLSFEKLFEFIKSNSKKVAIASGAVVLAIIIIVFIATLSNRTIKFKGTEEMYEHMRGVWQLSLQGEYLIFDDDSIYRVDSSIYFSFEPMFFEAIKSGNETLQNLKVEDCLKDKSLEEVADKLTNVQNIPQKGTIKISPDSEFGEIIRIKKDAVEYCEDISDNEYVTIKKVSDKADLNFEWVREYFEEEKAVYKPDVEDCIPSPKKYAEKLKEINATINGLTLAHDADGSTIYTNTGSTTNYRDVLLYTDEKTLASLNNKELQVIYTKDTGVLVITGKNRTSPEVLMKYVDAFFEDFPLAISTEELMKEFEENGKVESGYKKYSKSENEVKYTIHMPNSTSQSTLVQIIIESVNEYN